MSNTPNLVGFGPVVLEEVVLRTDRWKDGGIYNIFIKIL